MVNLSKVRQGEIALAIVKFHLTKKGVYISPDNSRELGNIAKAIGVSNEELIQFAKPLIQEILDKSFS